LPDLLPLKYNADRVKGEFYRMSDARDVLPIDRLIGRPVLSLSSGNKLGVVDGVFVDPINGLLTGLAVAENDGELVGLPYDEVYSFGHDAIMARGEASMQPADESVFADRPNAKDLIGTKIITAAGSLLGQIAGVFVTLSPPPLVIYEIRESLLDKLLGRQLYVPASAGHALSDDHSRLVVPDETIDVATPNIDALVSQRIAVRSYDPEMPEERSRTNDDTLVGRPAIPDDEDVTVVRRKDDDETVVRPREDDETTVIPMRRRRAG